MYALFVTYLRCNLLKVVLFHFSQFRDFFLHDHIVDFKLNTIAAGKYILLISRIKYSLNVFSGSAYGLF